MNVEDRTIMYTVGGDGIYKYHAIIWCIRGYASWNFRPFQHRRKEPQQGERANLYNTTAYAKIVLYPQFHHIIAYGDFHSTILRHMQKVHGRKF